MEVDDLTDEQSSALSRFREFTHIDSVETCRQYLSVHDWDVERAIETALLSDNEPLIPPTTTYNNHRVTTDDLPSAPPPPPPVPSTSQTNLDQQPVFNTTNPILRILAVPLMFLYAFYLKIEPFLPWTVLRFIFSFFQSLVSSTTPIDPLRQIEDYCLYFDNQYGPNHPPFYRGRLHQALRDAQREVRLLFIYLHDKNSQSCDRFCREVLTQDAIRSTIGDNLLWSASIDTQEGALASRSLHANLFPCFCIVAHHGSQQTVQLKLDRYYEADEFLAEVIDGVQRADQALQYNRERQNTRNSRDRLLEEQNAAYLDSVRADEEKLQQRLREENERRLFEENQRRLQEEQERKLREFAEFRKNLRQILPDEPLSNDIDTIQVSIRLPTTEPIRRRFYRTDPAKFLFEFAWTNIEVPDQFELLWGYPRKRYQYEQMGDKQINDVMSGNTETCYLEEIDDELELN